MIEFPGFESQVIDKNPDSFTMSLKFSEVFPFFEGHFDGFPILPGLIQMYLAIELARENKLCQLQFQNIPNIKFVKPIFPGKEVNLDLSFNDEKKQLHFKYYSGATLYSHGNLRV